MDQPKFTSLADYLGVRDPLRVDQPPLAPRPEALTGKQFAEALLSSTEFHQYVVHGLTLGTLPPAVLCRLMDHGWGKPVERLEVVTPNRLEDLTAEQLEERALYLAEVARRLRVADEGQESVH